MQAVIAVCCFRKGLTEALISQQISVQKEKILYEENENTSQSLKAEVHKNRYIKRLMRTCNLKKTNRSYKRHLPPKGEDELPNAGADDAPKAGVEPPNPCDEAPKGEEA